MGPIPPPPRIVSNPRIDSGRTSPRELPHPPPFLHTLSPPIHQPALLHTPLRPHAATPSRRPPSDVASTGGGDATPPSSPPPAPSIGHQAVLGYPAVSSVAPVLWEGGRRGTTHSYRRWACRCFGGGGKAGCAAAAAAAALPPEGKMHVFVDTQFGFSRRLLVRRHIVICLSKGGGGSCGGGGRGWTAPRHLRRWPQTCRRGGMWT